MSAIDKDILDTMTDEEREILESDEWKEDQDQAIKRPDLRDDAEESDDEDDDDTDTKQAEEPAAVAVESTEVAAPAQAPAQADAAGDEVQAPEMDTRKPAVYRAELPADFAARVQALTDEDAALADQFRAGEIDFDQFRAASAELLARRHELSMAKVKAEISHEMTEQTSLADWQRSIDTFMAQAKANEGIDYRNDKPKEKDLDFFIKALANDDENNDRPMAWFLTEAHRMVRAKHGVAAPVEKAQQASTKRAAPVAQVPKTLAGVPGTDGPGDMGGDEFQDLDRLEGLELEDAVARLSPAARAKYLSA